MNAVFNQVDFIHRLEAEGLARGAAEAIASGIDDGRRDLATTADLALMKDDLLAVRDELKSEIGRTRTELKTELKNDIALAVARQTIQVGVMLGAGLAIAVAVIGVIGVIGVIVSAH